MKVLITGGGGVIGGYVCRELLQAGHVVTSYSRSAPAVQGVTLCPGDVMDLQQLRSACRGHDAIVHLARSMGEQTLEGNFTGTVRVLDAAVQEGIGKLVFASTNAAVGFTYQKRPMLPRYFPIDEEHPSEPQDPYGLSKLIGETLCKSYSDAYGLQTICLRINTNWYLDRPGAEVAARTAWGRGRTVEEFWTQAYLSSIEAADTAVDWPTPGPPCPWKNLWAVTDARDGATSFRLALENDDIVHDVFYINGDETCALVETPRLLERFYPQVPMKSPLRGFDSLVSHQKATDLLGYRPQYSWRNSDFANWAREHSKMLADQLP